MKENSVLYSITHPKSPCRHFMFGTMHLANDDAYTHVHSAIHYLEKSTKFFGEMNLGEIDPEKMENAFRLTDGITLPDLMTKKQFKRLKLILLKAFGFDIQEYEGFIPFYIQSLLAERVLEKKHDLPLDYFLYQMAKSKNKILGGIESQEHQLYVLKQISLKSQLASLRKSAQHVGRFKRTILSLSEAYAKGSVSSIYKMSRKQLGSIRNLLLLDRNRDMATFIFENLQTEPCFFSFGAGHLAGGKGVIRLLKSKGCLVSPIH